MPEVLALFREGFGRPRSAELWRWRFRDNPMGGPLASIARLDADGRVVGCYLCLPFRLDLGGRPEPAVQVVDLVVHPGYRRQGMFEAMARHSYEMLGGLGYRALVAFPNPTAMSYPGFTRTLGWSPLCQTRRFTALLGIERAARKVLRLPAAARAANAGYRWLRGGGVARARREAVVAGAEYRTSGRLPEGYEALWDSCRGTRGPAFWKDAAYLRWRYDAHPELRFTYAFLVREGRLAAMAVTLDRDGARMMCELLAERGSVPLARSLVTEVCAEAFHAGVRSVGYYGCDEPFLAAVLRGFSRSRESENVLVGHALGDGAVAEAMSREQAWGLSFGDPDFV